MPNIAGRRPFCCASETNPHVPHISTPQLRQLTWRLDLSQTSGLSTTHHSAALHYRWRGAHVPVVDPAVSPQSPPYSFHSPTSGASVFLCDRSQSHKFRAPPARVRQSRAAPVIIVKPRSLLPQEPRRFNIPTCRPHLVARMTQVN